MSQKTWEMMFNNPFPIMKELKQLKDLTPKQIAYIKIVADEIGELEHQQSEKYRIMLDTLNLESTEELFDVCYNFTDFFDR